jgi:hypothetical protein
MVSTITWIYAVRLKAYPEGRSIVKQRTSLAFSDVRRLIAKAAFNDNFDRICPKLGKPTKISLVAVMLIMVVLCIFWMLQLSRRLYPLLA